MIAQSYITEWSGMVPWGVNAQVEQDLIICRALCSIYQDEFLAAHLGFTASHIPTYKEFVMNMEENLQDDEFLADTDMILGPGVVYDAAEAWKKVHDELVSRLMG